MGVIAVVACLLGALAFKSIRAPAVALVALYCMYGIEQWAQANSGLFLARATLVNILVAIVVALALGARYLQDLRTRERLAQYYPAVGIMIGLLLFYAFLTTLWTEPSIDASQIWRTAMPYWIVGVFAGPLLFKKADELNLAFTFQILFGGVVAALLLFGADWQGRVIVLNAETAGITQAGQGNPLATAEMAGITVICAVFAATSFRGSTLLRLAVAAICLLVIVRSGSRGQLLGLAFALAVAFPIRYSLRSARVFVAATVVAVAAAVLVGFGLTEYWGDGGRFSESAALDDYAGRIQMIRAVLSAWLSDTTAVVFGLGNSSSFDSAIVGQYPHIVPLEILAEEGLIGGLLYLAILLTVVSGIRRALKSGERDPKTNGPLAISTAIFVFALLLSLKQNSMLGSTTFFMSAIVVAKLCRSIRTTAVANAVPNIGRMQKGPRLRPTSPPVPSRPSGVSGS